MSKQSDTPLEDRTENPEVEVDTAKDLKEIQSTTVQIPGEIFLDFTNSSSQVKNTKEINAEKSTCKIKVQNKEPQVQKQRNTQIVSRNERPIEIIQRRVEVEKPSSVCVVERTLVNCNKGLLKMEDKQKSKPAFEGKLIPPIVNRPRGIPLSFLNRQNNNGAIRPQQDTVKTKHQPVWSLNVINEDPKPPTSIQNPINPNIPNYSQANPTFGQPMLSQPMTGQAIFGQPITTGQQMFGQPIYSQPIVQGQPMFQPMAGQTIFVQPGHTYAQALPTAPVVSQPTLNPQPVLGQISPVETMANMEISQNAYPTQSTPSLLVHVDNTTTSKEQYSPTDVYKDLNEENDDSRNSESPDVLESKQKRQSAFERLGPQTKPKKPKLTINLSLSKDQSVREVVDETTYVPVYERDEIMTSTDPTVVKFRYFWPWKSTIHLKRSVTVRSSKTVMIMEKEQVEDDYKNDNAYVIVSITGYPSTWTKEDVLDAILENLKDKSFIPCFIEFTSKNCKFLVNRCRPGLLALHYLGLSIRKGDVELLITISITTTLNTKQLDFIPRIVLRHRLKALSSDMRRNIDLKEFTLKNDISNFIYFPLNRLHNQIELMELLHGGDWENLQEIDLSYNRLTTLEGFDFVNNVPKLQQLNLSNNCLDSIKAIMPLRGLMLKKLWLEGNPIVLNYVESDYYVKVLKTIFPCLRELDGVALHTKDELPKFKQIYCPKDAEPIVDKFLETYFTLLDLDPDQRVEIENLYHKDAMLTVTSRRKLRYDQAYKGIVQLFLRSRCIEEANLDYVSGREKIGKLIQKWPPLKHDPHTFCVDVMMHDESSTLLRVSGLLKIPAASLAEDEHIVAFTRTVLLVAEDTEYKITNEMLYWDEPTVECCEKAFRLSIVQDIKPLTCKFDTPLDEDTKKSLINIFVKLTGLDSEKSSRYLQEKNWDLKASIEYFMKLVKLDNVQFN